MVTATRLEGNNEYAKFSFSGKSTDTKPTGSWEGTKIMNGSSFIEVDTQNGVLYDEEAQDWPSA